MMYISIDIGGTNTRVASSKDLSNIYKIEKFSTPSGLDLLKNQILSAVPRVSDADEIKGFSVGICGIIDPKNRKIKKVPNCKMLDGISFDYFFSDKYPDVPLFIQNDAALACLAESVLGSGKNYEIVAYITLSTGLGGRCLKRQKICPIQNMSEPGHHIIDMYSDFEDGAGIKGSFEAYCSGLGFERLYGMAPVDCDDEKIWVKYGKNLSVGLTNVIAMWDPQVIVLGGSISNRFDLFMPSVNLELKKITAFEIPPIVKSVFMDNAVLIGGLVLIKKKFDEDTSL